MSQQINLFNPIFLEQKKHFSAHTMLQSLGLILVGSFLVFGYAKFQISSLRKEADSTTSQLKVAQAQLVKVTTEYAGRQKSRLLEDEIQRAEGELKAQEQMLEVVKKGGFGNTRGYSEYMTAFARQSISGLWLTGFKIEGVANDIELTGSAMRADLVPSYINRLRHEAVMRGKSFSTLSMVVPEVDAISKANTTSASAAKRVPARYINFNLKSFNTPAEQGGADAALSSPAGVKNK